MTVVRLSGERTTTARRSLFGLAAGLTLAITLAAGGAGGGSGAGGGGGATPYTPPAVTAGSDGWETYADAPMVDAAAAKNLDPAPDSPEAAVVKYLAGRVRGDDAWRDALVASPSNRAERALDEWEEWEVHRFQLQGRKATGADSYYVRTFFEIAVGDDTDEGEDEFEVVREAGGWRVSQPPA
jgi:hypothetical protein